MRYKYGLQLICLSALTGLTMVIDHNAQILFGTLMILYLFAGSAKVGREWEQRLNGAKMSNLKNGGKNLTNSVKDSLIQYNA